MEDFIPRVGSASEEEQDEPEVIDTSKVGHAHYAGMNEIQAEEIFRMECLCSTCFMTSMCRVASELPTSLSVVSRCLAYLPVKE